MAIYGYDELLYFVSRAIISKRDRTRIRVGVASIDLPVIEIRRQQDDFSPAPKVH